MADNQSNCQKFRAVSINKKMPKNQKVHSLQFSQSKNSAQDSHDDTLAPLIVGRRRSVVGGTLRRDTAQVNARCLCAKYPNPFKQPSSCC